MSALLHGASALSRCCGVIQHLLPRAERHAVIITDAVRDLQGGSADEQDGGDMRLRGAKRALCYVTWCAA